MRASSLELQEEYRLGSLTALPEERLRGKWLPAILVCLFFLAFWAPPMIPTVASRWYVLLGLSIFAFLIQKAPLDLGAARLFWSYYGLSLLGAIVSLLRATSPDLALWNTVGMGISFVSCLLLLPVLATRLTRQLLLVLLLGSAVLWSVVIQQLVSKYGILAYSTFAETGDNKNSVGYVLALAATVLFYLAAFWKPHRAFPFWALFLGRSFLASAGGFLFYSQALIYARGSLVATLAGILSVLVLIYIKNEKKLSALLRITVISAMAVVFALTILPRILEISPTWNRWYLTAMNGEASSLINNRDVLLQKGIYLVSQNPFIGVGVGGSRESVSLTGYYFPGYLIHNTFLTDWAEFGILGLLSDLVWVLAYITLLRKKFMSLSPVDQIWLLIFIPLIVQMNFKNINSLAMVVILAGIFYEQYVRDHQTSSNS